MKTVSVFMITYNHEPFIGAAIESIVTQKVNFDFELVIGEDCSTDNTLAICKEYAAKYSHIVKLLPSDRNYGPMANGIRIYNACTGKYIAQCEGDDYWTTPDKLQKQVDFLEANPDFSMCFSAVEILDDLNHNMPYEWFYPVFDKDVFTMEDFILSEMNIIPTPTLLFRNVLPNPLPDFFSKARGGDMGIQLLAADKGKAKYFPEITAVYRNHSGGMTKSPEHIQKGNDSLMNFYRAFNEYFNYRYDAIFKKRFLYNAKYSLIFGARDKKGINRIRHYFRRMPEYIKYSGKINVKEVAYYHLILFFPSLLKKLKKNKL